MSHKLTGSDVMNHYREKDKIKTTDRFHDKHVLLDSDKLFCKFTAILIIAFVIALIA